MVLVSVVVISYTGYVRSYLDEEVQTTFFIKRYPALRMRFFDPFATEGDDVPIERLSGRDRAEFSAYCKFRLGMSSDDNASLRRCKAAIPAYMK